ncbi:MAG: DUF1289 domain-containing protein [Pseudomonadota bacterium]
MASDDKSTTDAIWRRNEVDSPCVKVCVLHHEARICIGCYRSGEEIARWSRLDPDERRRIMSELPGRALQLNKRRGGRRARQKTS